MPESADNAEKIKESIAALEKQRATLGDAVVDPAIAALKAQLSATATPPHYTTPPDERKLVTILFSDISGFTALSEKLDPEEVRRLINSCFDHLVPVVHKYEGTVDKFIGDEIMALFGAPIAHEDDPERALRAALEMMEAIAEFNRIHGTALGMHIGINTGPVVAGTVGAKGRRDYSVMGDAVNLAARLESASEVGEIFVGPATYRATSRLFDFEPVPPLILKGKTEPVEVHRLVKGKPHRVKVRGIEGLHAPLTGRDAELELIRERLSRLAQGTGCILSILGEAGLGKSRLIGETREIASAGIKWAEGRALSYTTGRNYWLVRDLVLSLLQINNDAAPAVVAEALQNELRQQSAEKNYPYLARMLGLPLDDATEEGVKFLPGDTLQRRIFEAVSDYISAKATQAPLLLVWEDLHWSDPSSLQTLEQIAPLVGRCPLLLICAARLEENDPVKLLTRLGDQFPAHSLRIELRPLTPDQSGSLMHALLKIDNLPARVRELIVQRAEGNPFYLEELLRSLLDSGCIVIEPTGPKLVREVEAVDVPETLQEVLSARIDRLQSEQKALLQKASVVGRIFNRDVLRELHSGNGERDLKLDRLLQQLEHRQFIQSRRHNESETSSLQEHEFIFKHAITHDVAYQSLLVATRKELHAVTARALEKLFPNRLDELSPVLGHHFQRADIHERAAACLARAAERAKDAFANEEAIAYYRSAIQATGRLLENNNTPENRRTAARLNESLGDLFTLTAQHEQARVAFNQAMRVGDPDLIELARLHRKIGFGHSVQRDFQTTEKELRSADAELEKVVTGRDQPWWEEKVQIQLDRLHLFYWQGMVEEMQALADQYKSATEEHGTPIQRSKFFLMQSLSLLSASRYQPPEECLRLAQRAFAASEESADLSERPRIQFVLGLVNLFRGNFDETITHCGAALELVRRYGDRVIEARCLTYLAVAHRRRGNVALAKEFAAQTLALASQLQMAEYVAMAKANLAWVAWKNQRLDDCEKFGNEALQLWHGMDDPYSFDWMALWPLIATALKRNEIERAAVFAEGLFPDGQHPLDDEVMSATKEAIDSWRKGNARLAQSQMKEALETAQRHHYI